MLDDQPGFTASTATAQSSTMAKLTTFADIPTEMVEKISSEIEFPEDFSSFRLSSRKACDESSDTFVRKFFVDKRILWTEHAFDAFAELTTNERLFSLFKRLDHVTFCAPPLLEELEEEDVWHLSESSAIHQALAYNRFCDQHRYFVETDWTEGHDNLRTFFRSLKEIRQNIGISLEGLAQTEIYEWSPLNKPAWGITHFMRHSTLVKAIIKPQSHDAEYWRYSDRTILEQEDMLGMVLDSISRARLDIVCLNLDTQWSDGCNVLLDERFFAELTPRLPLLEICFQSLHTLRLKVDLNWQHIKPRNSGVRRGLARFWSACPQLSILRYEGENDQDHGTTFLEEVLPLLRNGRLEDLEAKTSICDAEILCTVLRRHRSTLKRVRLQELDLGAQGPWEPVFDGLAKLSRLEHLSVGNLSCNDPNDGWCNIKFPDLSLLQRIATGFDSMERQMNPLDGRHSTGSEHADIAEYGEIDAMDTSDDHLEMKDEELQPTDSIVLDGDQITKLLPALRKHLIHEKWF